MQRRKFIKDAGVLAFGIGVFGHISQANEGFVGDTPTTTDILGPLYRPGAPNRQNLNPKDFQGQILHLSGTIYKDDGKTPMNNCLIEVWQCQSDGQYDNLSDDYSYRACQKTAADGKYHFITTKPVPYPAMENSTVFRPAHIHMRISSTGQQDLITQIYFKDDPHLETDPSTRSELAFNRILTVSKKNNNENEIRFDIVLKKEYLPDNSVFHKVMGVYAMNDKSMMEFYRDGDLLFYKVNDQIWGALSYAGNNSFIGGVNDTEARFELLPKGRAKVQFRFSRRREIKLEGTKMFHYRAQK